MMVLSIEVMRLHSAGSSVSGRRVQALAVGMGANMYDTEHERYH